MIMLASDFSGSIRMYKMVVNYLLKGLQKF